MARRTAGISGVAIALIGTGALLIRAAIRGNNPLEELRSILTRNELEPLSTEPRGSPLGGGAGAATGTAKGPGGKARTVGAKSHVAAEAEFIASTWNVVADATLVSTGHIPNSDHYKGLAIDVMLPADAQGVIIGNQVAQHYQSNAAAKNVKYVIWQHTIWSPNRGSKNYAKSDHMRHVHISFNPLREPSYRFRPAGR
jgi:hypothetical protein